MTKRYLLLLLSIAILWGCGRDENLPNTPETVVRAYQEYLDKNNFKAAKKLSTTAERERLDMIAHMLEDEPSDSTIITTTFLKLDCKENGSKASCQYTIEEFGERFSDSFLLINKRGQWLVDIIQEDFIIESDSLFEDAIHQMMEAEEADLK